jgi:hypothetical protein
MCCLLRINVLRRLSTRNMELDNAVSEVSDWHSMAVPTSGSKHRERYSSENIAKHSKVTLVRQRRGERVE